MSDYRSYVWYGKGRWIVMCQATSVAEARELAHDDSNGDGDWSTPVRKEMLAQVDSTMPEMYHRAFGKAVLTDSGELEESDAYNQHLSNKVKELESALAEAKAENARLRAPVSDEEPDLCEGCDKPLREDEGHETGDSVMLCDECWEGMAADPSCHAEECECELCLAARSQQPTEGR